LNFLPAVPNPPHFGSVPVALDYILLYILDAACIPNQGNVEIFNNYKTRIYKTLQTLCNAACSAQEKRIVKMKPQTNWDLVLKKVTALQWSDRK